MFWSYWEHHYVCIVRFAFNLSIWLFANWKIPRSRIYSIRLYHDIFYYGLIYGIIRLIFKRKINKGQRLSELQQSDELESGITLKATKLAYVTAMLVLIFSVVLISFYNALVSWEVHFIFTTQQFSVMCLVGSLIIIQLVYLGVWLKEYKKII